MKLVYQAPSTANIHTKLNKFAKLHTQCNEAPAMKMFVCLWDWCRCQWSLTSLVMSKWLKCFQNYSKHTTNLVTVLSMMQAPSHTADIACCIWLNAVRAKAQWCNHCHDTNLNLFLIKHTLQCHILISTYSKITSDLHCKSENWHVYFDILFAVNSSNAD